MNAVPGAALTDASIVSGDTSISSGATQSCCTAPNWEQYSRLPPEDELSEVERTARMVAAARATDMKLSASPLYTDPLVEHLAGRNALASRTPQTKEGHVSGEPGQHGHHFLTARTYILDVQIGKALEGYRSARTAPCRMQVVNLGAGMDTRPWRLDTLGPDVCWWEVDMPEMIQLKTRLLKEAGADVEASKQDGSGGAFPLKCGSFQMLPCKFAPVEDGVGLKALLLGSGFDPALPTVWVAEGLVYYLDMPTLTGLLRETAQLSPAGSLTLLTAVDKEALGSVQAKLQAARDAGGQNRLGKISWYNSLEDFATGGSTTSPSLMHELGWEVTQVVDYKQLLTELMPGHYAIAGDGVGMEALVIAVRT